VSPRPAASRRVRRYQAFGVCFSIEGALPRDAERLATALPPGVRAAPADALLSRAYCVSSTRRGLSLDADGVALATDASLAALLDALEGDLALHVAALAPAHVFIHAGVVAHRGRAIVLPGRTFSGKSTLVEGLLARGAVYYSDEYAVIDREGRVLPYPRPLSLRRARGPSRRVRPARHGRRPIRVGWVYGLKFSATADALAVSPISRGRAALLLMDNAVAARLAPRRVLSALRAAVEDAAGWVGVRGAAKHAARRILDDCQ